jgi:hypothetical protein
MNFPTASAEIIHAGNCFAFGEYIACVYQSMSAAEMGLRALASHLGVTLPYPIELADWGKLLGEIEEKIQNMQKPPKTADKDEELSFCSDAMALFRHFKNAYRNHIAHARAHYDERQAQSIMDRTREFIELLATQLKEPDFVE